VSNLIVTAWSLDWPSDPLVSTPQYACSLASSFTISAIS
jgi:hypothetical protein